MALSALQVAAFKAASGGLNTPYLWAFTICSLVIAGFYLWAAWVIITTYIAWVDEQLKAHEAFVAIIRVIFVTTIITYFIRV